MIKEIKDCRSCPSRSRLPSEQYACRELPPDQRESWNKWWIEIDSIDRVVGVIHPDCPLPKVVADPENEN